MHVDALKQYQKLYVSSAYMGSARILKRYLELDEGFPIPLSISHGVDMNHLSTAMDVGCIEPIHWCYSEDIYERALRVKPSIRLPHPWLILKATNPTRSGGGTLIVGPPPGKSNDAALLRCLKEAGVSSGDLLLKCRGLVDHSREFWTDAGFKVVTAGVADEFFYDRLFDLIGGYETIIGCTLSSALVFAAAIEKKIRIIENYRMSFYDVSEYVEKMDNASPLPGNFLRRLTSENYVAAWHMAEDMLGAAFMKSPEDLAKDLLMAIRKLEHPVQFDHKINPALRDALLWLSLRSGKRGFISDGIVANFKKRFRRRISMITMNEIDLRLNGLTDANFQAREVAYVRNVTEPGRACD